MKSGRILLVIATRNRPDSLQRMLSSVAEQDYRDVGVIVVDQSGTDQAFRTKKVIQDFSDTLWIRYRRSNGIGLSMARNQGLEMIDGADIIAFPDDDCWYPPGLLCTVARRFSDDSGVDVLIGQYAEPSQGWNPRFPQRPFRVSLFRAFGSSVGMFFRADVFLKSGIRFDEHVGLGTRLPGAEELDVLLSALKKGYVAWYDPSIVVYHRVKRRSHTGKFIQDREAAGSYVLAKHLDRHNVMLTLRIAGRSMKVALNALWSVPDRYRLRGMIQGYATAAKVRRGRWSAIRGS